MKDTAPLPEPSKHPEVPLPEKIGDYRIESLFKVGGMSLIYLGIHPKTGETVAVKVLRKKFLKDKEMASRLVREARVLGAANHPNIVKLYDLGQWEGGIFVAMEFIQGISLRQFIREKSLTLKKVLEIILQVSHGISHLHSLGIVHRDLKPENILITDSGQIKLIDFGISLFLQMPDADQITLKQVRMGTPSYMSPEQRETPKKVSYPTDIFALGMIAYELFLGKSSHGLVYPDLLPRRFRKIVEKALQSDPHLRHEDISVFIKEVDELFHLLDQEGDAVEEKNDFFKELKNALLPKKMPFWPVAEIGIALRPGLFFKSLYLDFLPVSSSKLLIFAAEAVEEGLSSLVDTAQLRGALRTAFLQYKEPKELLTAVKKALLEDEIPRKFKAALLLLDDEKGILLYLSFHMGPLLQYQEKSASPRILNVLNPPLGPDQEPFLQLEENWEQGDTLLFSLLPIKPKALLPEFLLFAPQPLAEKALECIDPSEHNSLILTIKRP